MDAAATATVTVTKHSNSNPISRAGSTAGQPAPGPITSYPVVPAVLVFPVVFSATVTSVDMCYITMERPSVFQQLLS